jgi:putative transposase
MSTVLDEYSRSIISWRLTSSMAANYVKQTLDIGIEATGVKTNKVKHQPGLLNNNGPCYLCSELKEYLGNHQMEHTGGAPYHPTSHG